MEGGGQRDVETCILLMKVRALVPSRQSDCCFLRPIRGLTLPNLYFFYFFLYSNVPVRGLMILVSTVRKFKQKVGSSDNFMNG